jgi:response regulator of citrate/malate metabolism
VITTLVVDDDPRVAAIHAEFVSKVEGFTVVGMAYSAAEAYEAVLAAQPDLLLLDLYLPDEHGLALLGRLRELDGPHPDAIIITASRDVESLRGAMQRGAVHYVVKPFRFAQLAERLAGYRTVRESLTGMRETSQAEIDKVYELLHLSTPALPPRGANVPTMTRILEAVQAAEQSPTAADISRDVGVSRPTAQRYLAQLVAMGLLDLELQYGAAGRPSHRYRARSR